MVDDQTKARVDQWIEKSGVNRFGDPPGTRYAGGTPLFSERTGQSEDRYDYILRKHPELRTAE